MVALVHVQFCVTLFFFFFQAEDGIRDLTVTGVQTCALPISFASASALARPMPREAPVTRAVFPERLLMMGLLDRLVDSESGCAYAPSSDRNIETCRTNRS